MQYFISIFEIVICEEKKINQYTLVAESFLLVSFYFNIFGFGLGDIIGLLLWPSEGKEEDPPPRKRKRRKKNEKKNQKGNLYLECYKRESSCHVHMHGNYKCI